MFLKLCYSVDKDVEFLSYRPESLVTGNQICPFAGQPTNVYRGSGGKPSLILYHDTGWNLVVSHTLAFCEHVCALSAAAGNFSTFRMSPFQETP